MRDYKKGFKEYKHFNPIHLITALAVIAVLFLINYLQLGAI